MNNDITPAQKANPIISTTDHEPRMNKLILALVWIGSWLDTLVLYAAFFPVLVRAGMFIPPTDKKIELNKYSMKGYTFLDEEKGEIITIDRS